MMFCTQREREVGARGYASLSARESSSLCAQLHGSEPGVCAHAQAELTSTGAKRRWQTRGEERTSASEFRWLLSHASPSSARVFLELRGRVVSGGARGGLPPRTPPRGSMGYNRLSAAPPSLRGGSGGRQPPGEGWFGWVKRRGLGRGYLPNDPRSGAAVLPPTRLSSGWVG